MMQSALTLATRIHRYPRGHQENICNQYRNRRGEKCSGVFAAAHGVRYWHKADMIISLTFVIC